MMLRLWVHEVFRVFYDRLIDDSDRAWLFNSIKDLVKEEFKENFETVFEHLTDGESKVKETDFRSLMFGKQLVRRHWNSILSPLQMVMWRSGC